MAIEIERKFLVLQEQLPPLADGVRIEQAYIPTSTGITVRVRLAGDTGFIGIKTRTTNLSRNEYEFPIPPEVAMEMFGAVCQGARIEKHRYLLEHDGGLWEIDVFGGANEGLIVAEIELDREDQAISLPAWIGEEVTFDARFSNYNLANNPYSDWVL